MKTEVLLRLDQDLFEAVTNGTPTGLSRNSFINDLLLEAFEQQNRSEDVRKAYNVQRIIGAAQRGHLDAIEREGGIEDMRAATDALYDLNNRLGEIRARRVKAIRG